MADYLGGRVVDEESRISASDMTNTRRRSCKGSCNEPQDTTTSHASLSKVNGTGRHQRQA